MTQKYHQGDHVQIAADLGEMRSHFRGGVDAIVMGSYQDQYGATHGGDREQNEKMYTLYLKESGGTSWYYDDDLTLIEAGRVDLLTEWKNEAKRLHEQRSDLDWIFAQGEDALQFNSSIEALGAHLGITNLWGARGEGFVYYENARAIAAFAQPFVVAHDKTGFLFEAGLVAAAKEAWRGSGEQSPPQ